MGELAESMFEYNGAPIMPSDDNKISDKGILSDSLEKALKGDTVKSVIIPEESIIFQPNYVLDFTGLSEMYEFQMEAIDSLLSSEGDVTLYAYTSGGLAKLGTGLSSILDRILPLSMSHIFNDKCKVYKDYKIGTTPVIVSNKDITTMRIGL